LSTAYGQRGSGESMMARVGQGKNVMPGAAYSPRGIKKITRKSLAITSDQIKMFYLATVNKR